MNQGVYGLMFELKLLKSLAFPTGFEPVSPP
jgi:hypothetical protein